MQPPPSSPSTPVSPHFWADWDPDTYHPEILRKDTRIYFTPQTSGTVGQCVGTFFGENPGGAISIYGLKFPGRSPIEHLRQAGDQTLRLILDVWIQAAKTGIVSPQDTDYIEVLNLYYFRNPKSGDALAAWNQCGGASIYSPAPSPTSKFVILGWGDEPNQTPQAAAAINLIWAHRKILIPDFKANVSRTCGPLTYPVSTYPAMPIRIIRTGMTKPYITNVAAQL